MSKNNSRPDAATGTPTAKEMIEIKTRFTTLRNGDRGLRMTIKCATWKFWHNFNIVGADLDYLKSDAFKEYAYSVFSKYEGLTYKEMSKMYDADGEDDFKKIGKKLSVCYPKEEAFKIGFYTKLVKAYNNGVKFKLQFGNNIDNQGYHWTITLKTGFDCRWCNYEYGYEVIREFESKFRKFFGDKLDKYTSWDEFINDIDGLDLNVDAVYYSMVEKYNKSAA